MLADRNMSARASSLDEFAPILGNIPQYNPVPVTPVSLMQDFPANGLTDPPDAKQPAANASGGSLLAIFGWSGQQTNQEVSFIMLSFCFCYYQCFYLLSRVMLRLMII